MILDTWRGTLYRLPRNLRSATSNAKLAWPAIKSDRFLSTRALRRRSSNCDFKVEYVSGFPIMGIAREASLSRMDLAFLEFGFLGLPVIKSLSRGLPSILSNLVFQRILIGTNKRLFD